MPSPTLDSHAGLVSELQERQDDNPPAASLPTPASSSDGGIDELLIDPTLEGLDGAENDAEVIEALTDHEETSVSPHPNTVPGPAQASAIEPNHEEPSESDLTLEEARNSAVESTQRVR